MIAQEAPFSIPTPMSFEWFLPLNVYLELVTRGGYSNCQ